MALQVGDRLSQFHVTALLGEGGMGQVWQAIDTQLNRRPRSSPTPSQMTRIAWPGSVGKRLRT